MKQFHFQTFDLNLLRLFDALFEEGSVTRAGGRLGMTQSAVSHALNRLRASLEDDLFVRGPSGMTPTPRAAQIWPEVRRGLDQLNRALAGPEFNPMETERRFNLAAPPAIAAVLLPPVVRLFRELAPHGQLRIQRVRTDTPARMEAGAVDVALASFGRLAESFQREVLAREKMVWVMRADHPAARQPLTVETLSGLCLLMIAIGDETRPAGQERRVLIDDGGAWERALGGPTARRQVAVTVDDIHAALAIVAENDMATLVPLRVAAGLAAAKGLSIMEPPYESSPLVIEMLWREDVAHDPGARWLLDVIRRAAPL
jgi:DNA-binding transcriptional LysR family regulator